MNNEIILLRKLVQRLLRTWPVFLLSVALLCGLALVAFLFSPSFYESQVSIMVEQQYRLDDPQRWILTEQRFNEPDRSYTVNEGIRMKEFDLALQTVKTLNLGVRYFEYGTLLNTELYEARPFDVQVSLDDHSIEVPYGVEFTVVPMDGQKFQLIADDEFGPNDQEIELDMKIPFGESFRVGDAEIALTLNPGSELNVDKTYGFQLLNPTELALDLVDDVNIEPAQLEGSIFIGKLTTAPKGKARDILKTLSNLYLERKVTERMTVLQSIHQTIMEQMEIASERLSSQEAEIENFKSSEKINSAEDEGRSLLEELTMLEGELRNLETRGQYLKYLEELLTAPESLESLVAPGAYGISDPVLNQMVVDYNELLIQQNALTSQGQKDHPASGILKIQVDSKVAVIKQTVSGFRSSNEIHVKDLKNEIVTVRARSASLPFSQMELLRKDRSFSSLDLNYRALNQRRSEVEVAMASLTANIAIVEPAHETSVDPLFPDPAILAIFIVFLSLLSPFVYLFFRTLFSTSISDLDWLREQVSEGGKCFSIHAIGKNRVNNPNEQLPAMQNTSSMLSELWTGPKKHSGRIVLMTNWDDALAQSNQIKLTLDVAERKAVRTLVVGFTESPQAIDIKELTEVLSTEKNALYEQVGITDNGESVSIRMDMHTSTELVHGKLMSALASRFDLVLIDAPSFKNSPEVSTWFEIADDVLVIAEFGRTIANDLSTVVRVNSTPLSAPSVVLTGTPPDSFWPLSIWNLFNRDGINLRTFINILFSRI